MLLSENDLRLNHSFSSSKIDFCSTAWGFATQFGFCAIKRRIRLSYQYVRLFHNFLHSLLLQLMEFREPLPKGGVSDLHSKLHSNYVAKPTGWVLWPHARKLIHKRLQTALHRPRVDAERKHPAAQIDAALGVRGVARQD